MRNMMLVLAAAVLVACCGCAMFNSNDVTNNDTSTIGQQLIDLKAARDADAITDAEYTDLKARIMSCGKAGGCRRQGGGCGGSEKCGSLE